MHNFEVSIKLAHDRKSYDVQILSLGQFLHAKLIYLISFTIMGLIANLLVSGLSCKKSNWKANIRVFIECIVALFNLQLHQQLLCTPKF